MESERAVAGCEGPDVPPAVSSSVLRSLPLPSKSHGTTSGSTALRCFPRKAVFLQAPATAPLICPCPHPAAGGQWCHLVSLQSLPFPHLSV